ncbi:dienelactone hydrolase family protein [Saccharopolyspora griseoalba]|uniref:Dienelactone hydrolase family protein n=1 Tax=Saccharopolyspora griseoalba TaxID=1431848 RepID=A0ABW2LM06_9PSEU
MTNPHQNTSFRSNGRTAHGYLAVPQEPGPGVVVVQEWWGLTDHVADVADRLCAEGFVALAPDLYGGRTTHDPQEAARMMQQLPVEQAARDLGGAVDHLLAHELVTGSSVGAVGFCMGGKFAIVLAAQQGDRVGAVVPFYGIPSPSETDFSRLTAPMLGHFGEYDRGVTVEAVGEMSEAVQQQSPVRPQIHIYPAGHAFFNDRNPASYQEESAHLAWPRTLDFLRRNLT